MKTSNQGWHQMLPGGLSPAAFTLDELRAAKSAHEFLTERIAAPEPIANAILAFRYLTFFGIACVHENRYPPLTACWKELDALFMSDPAFEDGVFVQSWILLDFPFGPKGETALDYFEQFTQETGAPERWQSFIVAARSSRFGLYQDVKRTKTTDRFRELITGRELSVFRSVEHYETGEIFLTRMLAAGEHVFMFGNPKCFPSGRMRQIEEMVRDKMFMLLDLEDSEPALYEKFMKVAGPYWMSCVTSDQDAPILDPEHYRRYLR